MSDLFANSVNSAISNVVPFPVERIIRVNSNSTTLIAKQTQKVVLDNVVSTSIEGITKLLMHVGIPVNNPETNRDLAIAMELLRCVIYKAQGISHPLRPHLHNMIKTFFNKHSTPPKPPTLA